MTALATRVVSDAAMLACIARAGWAEFRSRADPALRVNADAHWLFVFTSSNSGSTALAQLLASSANARRLHPNFEGQWTVPELRTRARNVAGDRVAAARLRAIWLDRLQRPSGRPFVVIEKSPSNLYRWRHVADSFAGMPQTRIVLTRAPMPTIASWIGRYGIDRCAWTAQAFGIEPVGRTNLLRIWARLWLSRAQLLHAASLQADLVLRYPDLCRDPAAAIAAIAAREPLLGDANADALLAVKDHPLQQLRDMDLENLRTLDASDRAILGDVLATQGATVSALGYALD